MRCLLSGYSQEECDLPFVRRPFSFQDLIYLQKAAEIA